MKNTIKLNQSKSLNVQSTWVTFFGMSEAVALILMVDKFIESTEQDREFKLPKREYDKFISYHNFKKACKYFEMIGLLRCFEDVNGIQAGVSYKINSKKLEGICEISLLCDIIYRYEELIKEYIGDDFSITDIKEAIK
jgi:hypothetical protein